MQNFRYSQIIRSLIIILDWGIIFSTVWIFNNDPEKWRNKDVITLFILVFLWQIISARTQIYSIPRMLTYTAFLERILHQIILYTACAFLISYISRAGFIISSRSLFLLTATLFLVLKSALFFCIKWARRLGYNYRNIMFLEQGGACEILKQILQSREDYGFKIFEYADEFSLIKLSEFWRTNGIHTVYLPLHPTAASPNAKEIMMLAEKNRVHINFVPDILMEEFATYELTYAQTQPILQRRHFPLEYRGNALLKRILDIAFTLLFFGLIGWWLFPVLAVLIRRDSAGPIFFKQKRYGYRDRVFYCYKFRTMRPNQQSESRTTIKDDGRITRFGAFLRRTSLDELPQFFNVLLGEMSVVGPRPHMISVDDHYREFINHYSVRNTVKPGLTGLAQIEGYRGDRGDMQVQMQKRVLADAFYVKNWSPSMDFIICIKTFIILLRGDKNAF